MMKALRIWVALAILCLAGPATAQRATYPTEVMFQAFTWNAAVNGQQHVWYRQLRSHVDGLAALGVTHMWLPPPSRSVSPQGYMPGDWYDLGHGDAMGDNRTLYGTADELKDLVAALKAKNIVPICDIVINHRCASAQENGVWNVFHHPSGKAMWEKWAIVRDDGYGGTGNADSGDDFAAAPDIDHSNPRVREDIKAWLRWLRDDIGFTGLRFDYSKGYGAQYAKEYIDAVQPAFAVGEYWTSMDYQNSEMQPVQDAHRQQLANWIDGTKGASCAFDFTTKGLLQEAVRRNQFWRLRDGQGKAAGLIGWWPDHAVTFVDNHDTGSTQAHWPFPGDKVLMGYAYILTHPGLPTIFWDHYMTWSTDVQISIWKLAQLRHELGINRASQLAIDVADNSQYGARVDGKLAVRLGDGGWTPGDGWRERLSGPGFKIWVH